MIEGGEGIRLHSRFNRVMALVVWATTLLVALSTLFGTDPRLNWVYPASALVAFLAWAALWRPSVTVDDDAVTLRNVTHTVAVPWAALIHVDTRYALTLHTPSRKYAAWSAPAPGILTSSIAGRRPANREARATGSDLRPGDLLGTDSGNVATVVRERWHHLVEQGRVAAGMADQIVIVRVWDPAVIGMTIALLAVTVWLLVAAG